MFRLFIHFTRRGYWPRTAYRMAFNRMKETRL